MWEMCSKLTSKTRERRHCRRSVVFIVTLTVYLTFFYSLYCPLSACICLLNAFKNENKKRNYDPDFHDAYLQNYFYVISTPLALLMSLEATSTI